jgi:AraC-like DNA-binding protein
MGVSTLHHHFRVLTSMSPLQYQKQLRLQSARNLMLNSGLDAASAAFEVGYESATQFNREYSRFFGQPPMETFERFFLRVLRNSNWSVASESGYSRSCCALSQWPATRQLARNALVSRME